MTNKQTTKIVCDALIFVVLLLIAGVSGYKGLTTKSFWLIMAAALIGAVWAMIDAIHQYVRRKAPVVVPEPVEILAARELILLDEENKPVKSWTISGKISVIIGRKSEAEVDVDLEDCEFGTFIDPQHAALNYCLDTWYLEDMGSTNGVRIRKAEDGICYKVTGRPCRVFAGDIIYIANTRLLLT